jgi:hypothetical protein
MKTYNKLFFVSVCLLLLTSCLNTGTEYLFIDLKDKVGEMRYSNIVTDAKDEKHIEEDFKVLINEIYQDNSLEKETESEPFEIISKELYQNGEQLDGRIKFLLRDVRAALKGFKIKTDENGNYIYELGEDTYVRGNGNCIERSEGRVVKWDKNTKAIEIEIKSSEFDKTKNLSLLSHWLDWKKNKQN